MYHMSNAEKKEKRKKKNYFGKCRTLNYFRGFLLFGHQTFGGQTIKLRDIFENGPSLLSRGKEEEFFFFGDATERRLVYYNIYIYVVDPCQSLLLCYRPST